MPDDIVTAADPRHRDRIIIVQNLFAYCFPGLKDNLPYPENKTSSDIIANLPKIDAIIQKYAEKFAIDRMAKVDLAILRLAVYELHVKPTQPAKAVINEAVELAKEFGGDKSYSLVNGILGKVINSK